MLTTFDSLGLTVLERGWLSSNSTVIVDGDAGWVVDSGYASHAPQTVELVQQVLGIRKLVAFSIRIFTAITVAATRHCPAGLPECRPGSRQVRRMQCGGGT